MKVKTAKRPHFADYIFSCFLSRVKTIFVFAANIDGVAFLFLSDLFKKDQRSFSPFKSRVQSH